MTTVEVKKDLFNGCKCFTKGNRYEVSKDAHQPIDLLNNARTINDNNEPHYIGNWYKHFKIIK